MTSKRRGRFITTSGFFAVGLLLSVAAPAAMAQLQFSGPTDYSVGTSPFGVVVGDFNGDGKPDLAVVNTGDQSVSILLGNGDGTFQPAVNYAAPGAPSLLAVGDFNGDGKLDLAVANGSVVSILLGNGDGSFQPHLDYNAGGPTTNVYVADFNADGKPDLLTPDAQDGTISLLLGNGDGTFQAPVVTSTQGSAPYVAIGDFNGDGKLDVATGNGVGVCLPSAPCNLIILLGNGDGTFQAPATSALYFVPGYLTTGDFNGDGKLYLAVEGVGSGCAFGFCVHKRELWTFLGNGGGTFGSASSVAAIDSFGCGGGQCSGTTTSAIMAVADLNNDGKLDLIVLDQNLPVGTCASSCTPAILTFLGNGDGTFQPVQTFNLATVPNWLALGDFNGDTLADVVVTNSSANSVSVLLNTTPSFTLSLTLAGSGGGTVISQPAVMNCKNSCIGNFASGTTVTLTATPSPTSNFAGWSGACLGASVCIVTMNASASATATFTLQDFSLMSASTKLTLQPGAQGTDVLTIAGLNGPFASAIQLRCAITGPAPMPACAFSATSVTPGSSSVTSTLTVTAPTTAALQLPFGHPQRGRTLYAWCLPLMLAIALVGDAKKQQGRYGLFCGLLLLLFLQTACGGSSSSGNGPPPPTNYTVTVTGAAGTIQHATQVTVTVQ